MLYAMRAPVPLREADLPSPKLWRPSPAPFVIDIGANVGWFTLNAAAAGGRVAAFEGEGAGRWAAGVVSQRRACRVPCSNLTVAARQRHQPTTTK